MSENNEVRDQNDGGAYSEDEEEHNILQARWLKLVKARHKDDELARKRSDENGRYAMFVCCQKGKRRKAGANSGVVGCDGCYGWLHQECLAENWEEVKAQDIYLCNFCRQAKQNESGMTQKAQQAANATVTIVEPQRESGFQVNHEDEVSVELDDSYANQEVAKWSDGEGITGMNRVSGQKFQTEYQEFGQPQRVQVVQASSNRPRSLAKGLICTSCGQNDVLSPIFTCSCGRHMHEACAYPLDLFLPADKELKCTACQKRSSTQKTFGNHSAQSFGFPQRASTPLSPALNCPCGKEDKTSVISCIKCARVWHMPCVRKELRFGSELICELCKSDDSLEERRRLAAPFLQAEERFSQAVAPTANKTSSARRPTDEIGATAKGRRGLLCNACHQPEMHEKDFTKLGCCKGCCRLLHTHCSGLASVQCLEWEECLDCQQKRRMRVESEWPQMNDFGRRALGTDANRMQLSSSGEPRGLNNVDRNADPPERYEQNMRAGTTNAPKAQYNTARNEAIPDATFETPPAFQNKHPTHNTGLDLTWVEDLRRELKEVKDRLNTVPANRPVPVYLPNALPECTIFDPYEHVRALPHNTLPHAPYAQETRDVACRYGHDPYSHHAYPPGGSAETLDLRQRVKELEAALSRQAQTQSDSRNLHLIRSLPEVPHTATDNSEKQKNRNAEVPGDANLVKMLAEALGGNRVASSLNNIKFLDGEEGPEQIRRWFSEFELITREWKNEERRQALQIRVKGKAATALQLMPPDLLDDYFKIKGELLLRLADDEPRRSANLTCMLSGCPRQLNESIEQFGARVHQMVRGAMSPQCPLSQVDEIAKKYFVRWLNDKELVPSLVMQADRKEFRYLVDQAASLRRTLDVYAEMSCAAPPTNKPSRPQGGQNSNTKWTSPAAGQRYTQNWNPVPEMVQPRYTAHSGSGINANSQNAQNTWVKPAQGQFRAANAGKSNTVAAAPHNANAVQTAGVPEVPASTSVLTQHQSSYHLPAFRTGQTHNSLSVVLPVSALNKPASGPCAIGPVPKKDIFVEMMPAVSLFDSGAPVSIAEAGYVKGLLEAKGVDPDTWPIDPPSTAISVANGDPLDCIGSTILQVSIGGDAKPVRVQLTRDNLSYPVIIGTNAFADLGIKLISADSGANMHKPEPLTLLSAGFPEPPDKSEKVELSASDGATSKENQCTGPPGQIRVTGASAKRKKKRTHNVNVAEPEIQLSVRTGEEANGVHGRKKSRRARENDSKSLNASNGLNAFCIGTAFGPSHWLRNMPKANATFPLRRLDLLQHGSAGNAPETQPATPASSYDAYLHSTHTGRITRHSASSRSSPRSSHDIDSHLPNEAASMLKPSGPPPSKFDHDNQPRK